MGAFVLRDTTLPFPYPKVLSARATLDRALSGTSIARFGDGELRIAMGRQAISQVANANLQGELKHLLRGPTHCLVCIPRQGVGPKADRWINYSAAKYVNMMEQEEYGSAFITRPDSEPIENEAEYWGLVRDLWRNRDVVLVVGTDYGSLDEKMLRDARNLRVVFGPRRDAYAEIAELEEKIGTPPKDAPVIMCLGATASVLAERLARKGCWALDLGHIGKFMPKHYR